MKCPACFSALSSVTIGSLTADVCRGGCGGVWFDAFELQQVDEPDESAGEWLVNIERDPRLRVDLNRKRACPKCDGIKLKRRHFSAKRQVEIDECPGCGGCWLDSGELEKIRDETGESTRQKEALAGTQLQLTAPLLRYLYQIRVSAGK